MIATDKINCDSLFKLQKIWVPSDDGDDDGGGSGDDSDDIKVRYVSSWLKLLKIWFVVRHAHKSTVMQIKWNLNGNWLLTASRDHLVKLFDIRMMKELQTFRGHKREATGRYNWARLQIR